MVSDPFAPGGGGREDIALLNRLVRHEEHAHAPEDGEARYYRQSMIMVAARHPRSGEVAAASLVRNTWNDQCDLVAGCGHPLPPMEIVPFSELGGKTELWFCGPCRRIFP